MTHCDICKKKEATVLFDFRILEGYSFCNLCYLELIDRFRFFIAGEQVTKEEYDKRINGE